MTDGLIEIKVLCHTLLQAGLTIRIYHECEGGIEKSDPRITNWHHKACRVMTNSDREGQLFYPILTQIMDYFSCSPLSIAFDIGGFKKIMNSLMRHGDVILK